MTRFSIAIMMHPSREQFKDYLMSKLGDVPIEMDRGQGLWDTARRAWMHHDPSKDFHFVIQDDAIICNNFLERVNEKLQYDKTAYSLYYGKRQRLLGEATKGMGAGYIIKDRLPWCLAVGLPTRFIKPMLNYCDKMTMRQDDARISKFLRKNKIKVYFPMPSLVDHRQELKSLVGDKDNAGRMAYSFIDNYENQSELKR